MIETVMPDDGRLSTSDNPREARLRRGPLMIVALLAGLGAAAICLLPLPAELRTSVPFGTILIVLGLALLGTVGAVLVRPTIRNAWFLAGASGLVVVYWALARLGNVITPDPWAPVNSVIGFNDDIVAGLAAFTGVVIAVLAALGERPGRPRWWWRALTALGMVPLVPVVVIAVLVGVLGASDGSSGAGFPAGTVPPEHLAAGQRSTVEYCLPGGIPLAMDIYTPPANAARPAPVALYVHGGGLIFGDRKVSGVGATLADQAGALFTPLQRQLNARGFVVASIDYRTPPATPWPAQLEDVQCAVRFLRAHAAGLGIDPHRIGAWGSSAGALLVSLLGLNDNTTATDGQYADQSSSVGAVVDMFGPADLTNLTGSEAPMRIMVSIGLGDSDQVRRSASPADHVSPDAPPFLVLQGTEDTDVPQWQSELFATRLRAAHIPVNLVIVQGAGHGLATPSQHPSPDQVTATVTDFLSNTLKA